MRAERLVLVAALAAGVAARVLLAFARPLWADEIYTLTLARRGPAGILDALRLDSGPPLHYLVAWFVLLPAKAPAAWDGAVRAVSLAASLLHLPLLVRLGNRLVPDSGGRAAAAFALFPLAVLYAAEGRAYALASLLLLVAFERALALRAVPAARTGAAVAAAAAGAALSHYLSAVVLAGFVALLVGAAPRARRALLLAFGAAGLLAAVWIPVALGQPLASMAWTGVRASSEAARHLAVGFAGQRVSDAALPWAFPLALALLALVAAGASRRADRRLAATTAIGVATLLALGAARVLPLLPERSAVLFLPFVALLAASRRASVAPLLVVSALALPILVRDEIAPTPGQRTADLLLATAERGERVLAAGLWGPEIAYRFARAGRGGDVVLFPSDVARHPGWYDESAIAPSRLAREAREAVDARDAPRWWVLPPDSVTAAALSAALGPAPVVARTPFWTLRRAPDRRQATDISP